jgi:hypothetical protein
MARARTEAVAKVRRPMKIRGTLDIECSDWDRFAVAATYDGRRARVYYSGDEMIDQLRRIGGIWLAHGGGVYDNLYVLEQARVRVIPCQVDRSQHRVTRVVMGRLTLRDSYSLWPVPLDEICGALGRAVPKLPWPCVCRCTCARVDCTSAGSRRGDGSCGRSCGGYCQIGDRAARGDPELEDYVKADAKSLYDGYHFLADFTSDHGVVLRGTLGQTAWVNAQDEIRLPNSEMPFHLWRHARAADKGGRIAVVRPLAAGPGAHHDICNAYPAQLAHAELPVGDCYQLGPHHAQEALEEARPGIYLVSVTVPEDSFLPPLPWAKAGQLAFPTGEFSGSWVLPELVAAFERGTKLRAVHSALVWDDVEPVFAPLVKRWYQIRREVGRKTPMGNWMGRLAKAFTGKLAERPDRQRAAFHVSEVKICSRRGACRGGCTKRCGAYEQLDLYGHIWGIPYQRMSDSAYPQWSAYLRALTRIQWLTQAERMGEVRRCSACGEELGVGASCVFHPRAAVSLEGGGRALCLGNTDSLWHTSRQAPEPLGDDLGEWEYQHAWTDLEVRSPTVYAFRDPAQPEEGLQIRGIPGITEEDWRRGRGSIDRGIVTFGRAVKTTHGLFHRRTRNWSLPAGAADREWYGDRKLGADGLTYPASADELRALGRQIDQRKNKERSA